VHCSCYYLANWLGCNYFLYKTRINVEFVFPVKKSAVSMSDSEAWLQLCLQLVCLLSVGSAEEDLGSSEESGKDWDELEEEAKKGCECF